MIDFVGVELCNFAHHLFQLSCLSCVPQISTNTIRSEEVKSGVNRILRQHIQHCQRWDRIHKSERVKFAHRLSYSHICVTSALVVFGVFILASAVHHHPYESALSKLTEAVSTASRKLILTRSYQRRLD